MTRRGLTLALLAATAALLSLSAQAYAGKWIDAPSSSPLGESMGIGSFPTAAMNSSGAQIVAWYEGTKDMARVRQGGGGPFGPQMTLNVPATGKLVGTPYVAVGPAGDMLATWIESEGASTYSVVVASAAPGQPFGAPTTIPGSVGSTAKQDSAPLFLSDGTALILWSTYGGALEYIRRPPGGDFSAPIVLVANEVTGFAAASEPGDSALVSWTETNTVIPSPGSSTTTYTLKSAEVSAAGTVSGKQTIDTKQSTFTPSCSEPLSPIVCTSISLGVTRVASDPMGDGLIAYLEASESSGIVLFTSDVVKAAYRVAGSSSFETPVGFPPVSTFLGGVGQDASLLGDGTALVAWEDETSSIRYAERPRLGAFPAAGAALTPSPGGTPRIAVLGADAVLAYVHSGKEVLAQEFTAGGPQGLPVQLSRNEAQSALGPVLAGDGSGDAVAAWERRSESSSNYDVEAADYDGGPRLSNLAVPASGVTGAALPFSVTAVDPLSPVTTQWTFGDGAKATGTSVSHAYAAPGAQTASVVARNAAGMSSAILSGVTQVTASGPGPGGTGHGAFKGTLKIPRQRLRDVLRKGLVVSVGCASPCRLGLRLQVSPGTAKTIGLAAKVSPHGHPRPKRKPVTVGRLSVTLKAAGTKTVHVRLTKKAKQRLAHVRKLTLSVIETVSGGGAAKPLTRQVTLR